MSAREDNEAVLALGAEILRLAEMALTNARNPYNAILALSGALQICIRVEKDCMPQLTYSHDDIATMAATITEAYARETYSFLLENGELAAVLGKAKQQ